MFNKGGKKNVVISASNSQKQAIEKWLRYWQEKARVINYPVQIKKSDFKKVWPKIHKDFYSSLLKTDIHFIANEDKGKTKGYIGVGVFAEISFSMGINLTRKKKIDIILTKLPDKKNPFYTDIKRWKDNGWIKLINKKILKK